MPRLDEEMLTAIVRAHLGPEVAARVEQLITLFEQDLRSGQSLAVDQLLSTVFLLTGEFAPSPEEHERLKKLLMRELTDA
jgi:hypothetical protein